MSNWIEIKDADSVSIDTVWGDIHILYGYDDFGNNYISIPTDIMIGALVEAGFKIEKP